MELTTKSMSVLPCVSSEVRCDIFVDGTHHGSGAIKMPGLQSENIVAALGSPIRKNKLSLKFLQKKDTKRALDFSESQAEQPKVGESGEPEARWVCDVTVGFYLESYNDQNTS